MSNNDFNKQTEDLETQNTMNRIYTVGHSNYEIEKFIQLLKGHNITAVYDVRSVPYSKYAPQFNQGLIKQYLESAGIEYVYLGKELGPFSKDLNCCVEGIVQYNLLAQTKAFRDGLSRIKKEAQIYNLALMCAEKEPAECHRMILVCRHLRGEDIEIKHILEDGNLEDNRDTERRLMKMLKISDLIPFGEIEDPVERAYEEMGKRNAFKHRNDTPDPQLFKNRIEMVNRLGVIGERRNIGIYQTVIDSSLLPMGTSGSEALAAKNSGPQGSGKSHPLFTTLKLYPKSAYYLITSGSAKSLYNLNDGLKHKALILTEALQLQSGRFGDNELAYSIRTLVSEGRLKYQYTGFIDKKKVTIVQELKGPTSLLTTTIHGKLEEQLEDRMITIHPNTTAEQTRDIISTTAEMASGNGNAVDQKTLDAWKLFYELLEPVVVVIPYAKDIAEFINRTGSLPIASRRAFKRVLATIKTIALIHQKQRLRDDMGNVIAEYSDYALSYQLVGDAFRESLGEGHRYTDDRKLLIEKEGQITPRALSEKEGVTTASISQWLKPLIEKGVLTWCDGRGHGFMGVADLEKAKRSGRAYLMVVGGCCLPTVFELTGDPSWDKGGDLYAAYDLHLDGVEGDQEYHQDKETVSGQDVIIDDGSETSNDKPAVKVLSEKSHAEVLKMVDDFKKNQPAIDPNSVVSINLSNEFEEILSLDRSGLVN